MPYPRAILAVAVACLGIPAVPAELNVRSFFDLAAEASFGNGVGVYDPSMPYHCLALFDVAALSAHPAYFYYESPLRWHPATATSLHDATNAQTGVLPGPLSGCPNSFPPGANRVRVDALQASAGSSWMLFGIIAPTEVAMLAQTTVTVQYCRSPGPATIGPAGIDELALRGPLPPVPLPAAAFLGRYVDTCGDPGGFTEHVLFPGCPHFGMVAADFSSIEPVYMVDGPACNTHVGSGQSVQAGAGTTDAALAAGPAATNGFGPGVAGTDYLVQVCASTGLFDSIFGSITPAQDSDFFVAGHDGALLNWAATVGTAPGGLFPNVANLASDDPSPSC